MASDWFAESGRQPLRTLANYSSANYFQTLGIPLLQGRPFNSLEDRTGAAVAIISESGAQRLWPNEVPLGKRLKLDLDFHGNWAEFEVIGVAKDVRTAYLSRVDMSFVYLPTRTAGFYRYFVMIRTIGDPAGTLAAIRTSLETMDKNLASGGLEFVSIESFLRIQRVMPQSIAIFASILASLALVLAAVGIYGVTSYLVS